MGRATNDAGKMFNVGKTYVSEAKKVREVNPELFQEEKNFMRGFIQRLKLDNHKH